MTPSVNQLASNSIFSKAVGIDFSTAFGLNIKNSPKLHSIKRRCFIDRIP